MLCWVTCSNAVLGDLQYWITQELLLFSLGVAVPPINLENADMCKLKQHSKGGSVWPNVTKWQALQNGSAQHGR